MNVIFGSGAVGLLAKLILGPKWKVIPFKRSRFFSWNPALDDNFIMQDDEIDPFIKDITNTIGSPQIFLYKKSWSIGGQIIHGYDKGICDDWLNKIFGAQVPTQSHVYMKDKMDVSVYNIMVNGLYHTLVNKYIEELKIESQNGEVTEIGAHYFIRNGIREDFDKAISTIPLDALFKFMNIEYDLPAKNVYYVHLETKDLDFENSNQLLVVDQIFDFWKSSNIAPNRYLLYFHNDVVDYGLYLMNFIKKFDILDGTVVRNALPMGEIPKMADFERDSGIYCVGSYAQWDWCMDIGSCILRLLRYSKRGDKPQQSRTTRD